MEKYDPYDQLILECPHDGIYSTPDQLISKLETIIGENTQNQKLFTPNFKTYIKDLTKNYACPYTVLDSNLNKKERNRKYIKFICYFHTKERKSCSASFSIFLLNDIIIDIKFVNEHNHNFDPIEMGAHADLTQSQMKEQIKSEVANGMSSGYIRRKFNIDLSSDQLYNISRNVRRQAFSEDIRKVYNDLPKWNKECKVYYDTIKPTNLFAGLTLINRRLIGKIYANDICELDDTLCTNIFGYPIIPIYVYDEHNHMQILAIGVMCGKKEPDFEQFLTHVKEAVGDIRVFISDRLQAQQNGIEKVFQNPSIVFCKLHIRRNIEQNFGKRNNRVLELFDCFMKEEITRSDYLKALQQLLSDEKKHKQHIQNLIEDINHYDPTILDALNCREHNTSNGAEGMFSNLKNWIDHKITSLSDIIDHLYREMSMLMQNNFRNACSEKFKMDDALYNGCELGLYARRILTNHFVDLIKLIEDSNCKNEDISNLAISKLQNCTCAPKHNKIPCIHDLYVKFLNHGESLLGQDDIPPIYWIQKLSFNHDKTQPKINMIDKVTEINPSYNDLMNIITPLISAATHDPRVMNEFRTFIEKVESLKVSIDPGAEKTLQSPGAPMRYPSSLVDHKKPGRPKTKRRVKCSNCGRPGHNRSSCTFHPKTEEQLFIENAKKTRAKQMQIILNE